MLHIHFVYLYWMGCIGASRQYMRACTTLAYVTFTCVVSLSVCGMRRLCVGRIHVLQYRMYSLVPRPLPLCVKVLT